MKSILAISIATIYGLSVRLMFTLLDSFMGVMSVTFLIFLPMIIGFLTVYLLPKESTKSSAIAFWQPWLTSLFILIITVIAGIEGTICWIMIYPLFAVLAGIGGIIAFNIKQNKPLEDNGNDENDENNENEKPNKPNIMIIFFILLLPTTFGFIEGEKTLVNKELILSKEIIINASAKEVWRELTQINDINNNQNKGGFTSFIGFPKHLKTTLDTIAIGGKRLAVYEKGLFFEETISALIPQKLMKLSIHVDPTKIPATVLDEHIVIGGKHVNIYEDTYQLEELPNNKTKLILSSKFSINTPFNWYAGIWAKFLMADILENELALINERLDH